MWEILNIKKNNELMSWFGAIRREGTIWGKLMRLLLGFQIQLNFIFLIKFILFFFFSRQPYSYKY